METVEKAQVYQKIAEVLRLPVGRVTETTRLTELVTDSFVLIELVVEIQEDFGAYFVQDDVKRLVTAGDVADLVQERTAPGARAATG